MPSHAASTRTWFMLEPHPSLRANARVRLAMATCRYGRETAPRILESFAVVLIRSGHSKDTE